MPTLTRGAVVLTPSLVEPVALTRAGRTVVHQVLGDTTPDLTVRDASRGAGDVVTVWPTRAAAVAARDALAVAGASWLVNDGATTTRVQVVGDIAPEVGQPGGRAWTVTLTVQEVPS